MTAPRATPDRSRLIQGVFFAVVLALWWFATSNHRINAIFLPAPSAVLVQIGRIFGSKSLPIDAGYTFGSFAAAFAIAAVLGLFFGYIVSARRFLTRVYEPLLASLYAVPLVVFFPTFILFFGSGPKSKIALGAAYAFFPIAINTISGFTQVDYRFITAARSMGASNVQLLRRVLLPAALPVIVTGLRIAFIACFASILAGEMIAADHGLGHEIALTGQMMENARMFGYVALVVIAAFVFNAAVSAAEARSSRRD